MVFVFIHNYIIHPKHMAILILLCLHVLMYYLLLLLHTACILFCLSFIHNNYYTQVLFHFLLGMYACVLLMHV